jgi:hypothetical protein
VGHPIKNFKNSMTIAFARRSERGAMQLEGHSVVLLLGPDHGNPEKMQGEI